MAKLQISIEESQKVLSKSEQQRMEHEEQTAKVVDFLSRNGFVEVEEIVNAAELNLPTITKKQHYSIFDIDVGF